MDKTPVMIFVVPKAAEKENMYQEKIQNICNKRIVFKVIDTVKNAGLAQTEWKGKKTCVCRVTADYALGYDFMMGSHSFVIFVVRDWERVTISTLDQMISRSSRDQGLPEGKIIIMYNGINPGTLNKI